jgi:rod shape-determining protein MreB
VLSKKIGIDLGTAFVRVYVKGEGVVVTEPDVVAVDRQGTNVLAIGSAAGEVRGREGEAQVVRPVRDGNVADYRLAGAVLQQVVSRVCGRQRIFRPDVMVSVRPSVTGVERRAVLEATMQAGARSAYLIETPYAAALGAGLRLADSPGVAVCDIGAARTEFAVLVRGDVVLGDSWSWGGMQLDHAIAARVQEKHDVVLEEREAERVKIALAAAGDPPAKAASIEASGNRGGREQMKLRVLAEEVRAAIGSPLEELALRIREALARLPGEVRAQLAASGIVLTGGGALLAGLDAFLRANAGLPVRTAANPQTCVAVGTGLALDNLQVIRRGQRYIA